MRTLPCAFIFRFSLVQRQVPSVTELHGAESLDAQDESGETFFRTEGLRRMPQIAPLEVLDSGKGGRCSAIAAQLAGELSGASEFRKVAYRREGFLPLVNGLGAPNYRLPVIPG
jgi:hypothetical protein